jgi:hypothetical protein
MSIKPISPNKVTISKVIPDEVIVAFNTLIVKEWDGRKANFKQDEVIKEAFNFRGEIKFDTSKPDGQFRKPSDNSVIKSLYPDFKFTGIEEGIKKSVEWFTNNYPNNTRL